MTNGKSPRGAFGTFLCYLVQAVLRPVLQLSNFNLVVYVVCFVSTVGCELEISHPNSRCKVKCLTRKRNETSRPSNLI